MRNNKRDKTLVSACLDLEEINFDELRPYGSFVHHEQFTKKDIDDIFKSDSTLDGLHDVNHDEHCTQSELEIEYGLLSALKLSPSSYAWEIRSKLKGQVDFSSENPIDDKVGMVLNLSVPEDVPPGTCKRFTQTSKGLKNRRYRKIAQSQSKSITEDNISITKSSIEYSAQKFRKIDIDVLLGRGKDIIDHPGNVTFRNLAMKFSGEYKRTSKPDKKNISIKLVNEIHKLGGKFLSRDLNSLKYWVEVSKSISRKKASQALRDCSLYKSRRQLQI